MIPKIIHYCWFGRNPLPPLAIKCINSWKKFFPDYEIKEWNEDNFNVDIISYTSEAYKAKKYAFVSDYARFWILYNWGGLYFDTDVEVINPMEDMIKRGAFMGCEYDGGDSIVPIAVNAGLGLAAEANMKVYKDILDCYSKFHFANSNGSYNQTTVVVYITDYLLKSGLKNVAGIQELDGLTIYPKDYLCPLDFKTKKITKTSNTRTIHHYSASWYSKKQKLFKFLAMIIGKESTHRLANILKNIRLLK